MRLKNLLSFLLLLPMYIHGVNVPYSFEFTNESKFNDEWTVFDNNADQSTWKYDPSYQEANCGLGFMQGDDWLISVPIYLDANSEYHLSYSLRTFNDEESILVALGTASSIEAMTRILADYPTLSTKGESQSYEMNLTVEKSDNYYLGFKYYSPAFRWGANVGTVKITKVSGLNPPKKIEDITLTADQNIKTIHIEWKAPLQDIENQPLTTLSKIELFRNNELIHTISNPIPGSNMFYDDQPSPFIGEFTYKLISYIDNQPSDPTTKSITIEPLPTEEKIEVYKFLFDNQSVFDNTWTIINANNDNKTWKLQPYVPDVYYSWATKKADDWLISPAITMEAGKRYTISYFIKSSVSFGENLKVFIGKANTVEGQTTLLKDYHDIKINAPTLFDVSFVPEENADYYIGFYCYSEPNRNWLNLSKFKVECANPLSYASAVTNLKAVELESNKIEISWNNPLIDSKGDPIYVTLPKVELFRNETLIKNFTEVKAGAAMNYIDEGITDYGEFTYKVIPYINSAPGEEATITINIKNTIEPKSVPYTATFDNESEFKEWTIIYSNNESSSTSSQIINTWDFETEDDNHFVRYNNKGNTEISGKDWFISPSIQLYKDACYYIEMDIRTPGQNYTITFGNSADVLNQTEIIAMDALGTKYETFEQIQYPLTITQDGLYNFAISSHRVLNTQYLDLDNISIKEGVVNHISEKLMSHKPVVYFQPESKELICQMGYHIIEIFDMTGTSLWKSAKGAQKVTTTHWSTPIVIVKIISDDNEILFIKTKN